MDGERYCVFSIFTDKVANFKGGQHGGAGYDGANATANSYAKVR